MKSFTVAVFFPEAKAHVAYQGITIPASDFGVAARLAIRELRRRPGIAGKHITEVRLTIKEVPIASPGSRTDVERLRE